MEALRVLIADDHPLFRHGIREILNLVPDIQVIGEASTPAPATISASGTNRLIVYRSLK